MSLFWLARIFFRSIVTFVLLFVLVGCDRQTRYQLISTVFTGVPSYEEFYADTPSAKDIEKGNELEKVFSQHPLWGAGKCGACHSSEVEKNVSVESYPNDKLEETLVLPPNKLCVKCHADKTPRRAIRDKLWLHNPVAKGDCLACHAHHQSNYTFLLKRSYKQICTDCHSNPDLLPDDCTISSNELPGAKLSSCLSCHNSHMGADKNLLHKDYVEVKRKI